jgi:hypothetical protein
LPDQRDELLGRSNSFAGTGKSCPATAVPVAMRPLFKVDTDMNDDEPLASVEKHVQSLRALLTGNLVDESLPKELSRPVLLLLMDELKTLDARLTA